MAGRPNQPSEAEAWTLDQLAKSVFFHRKLHEWKLLETATALEQIHGESLDWNDLQISDLAWNRIIHRGIKPVIVFAHPFVLHTIPRGVAYYRMLAMVSQKSMKRVGFSLDHYQSGRTLPDEEIARLMACHFNAIVSRLVEADEEIDAREFDLWRGMAAGSQAQGSWQNTKGSAAEIAVKEMLRQRLTSRGWATAEEIDANEFELDQERRLVFADEPDVAVYRHGVPQVAIEIKGGIDPAGVLERIGAALKSLRRTRQENPQSVTILIVQEVSMTERARTDLSINVEIVTHLFSLSAVLDDPQARERLFQLLNI